MCYKEKDKNQNYPKEKFIQYIVAKKNNNHTDTFNSLKANRNHQTLLGSNKINFLLIYIIIMIKIKVTSSLRHNKLNKLNEITIKITGTGEQYILNSKFSPQPSKVLVNGGSANIDLQNKISISDESDINIITMEWDETLINCEKMFLDLTNLKEVDLSNFDGTKIESMRYMFWDCTNLESVNFNNIKTPSLTNIALLFSGCNSLLSVDLSSLNTSSVINMASMFIGCSSLKSVNLTNLDTSNVKSMEYLFYSCTSLESVDLSNFDTSAVTNMNNMFSNCFSLTSLDLSKFNTDSLELANSLFSDCKNLTYINIQNFDLSKTASLFGLFKGCQNLEFINLYNFIEGDQKTNINNFFDEVPNNITYCIKNKNNAPLILEELNKRTCTINDCSDDWNTKQKLEITEKNKCVYNCSEDIQYIHQFKNKCYDNCPNGTILSSDNKCVIQCTKDNPFEFQEECISVCKGIDFFNNLCTINNKSIEAKETMIGIIENDIVQKEMDVYLADSLLDNKNDLIVYEEKEIYQITSSFNQNNNENNKVPTIYLGKCENILKEENNINNNESLIIFKMEYYIDDFLIPITEYEVFNPKTKEKLELNVCNNIKIKVKTPVQIEEDNLYKYNPYSEFYKDKCYPNEECGDENILIQRINEFNNNHLSLCEKNCEFISYDIGTKNVLCECEIKIEFTKLSDLLNNKNNLLFFITEPETDIFTNSYTEALTNKYTNINENTEALTNKYTNKNEITESLTNKYANIDENSDNIISQITDINSNSNECLFIERKSKECYNLITLKDLLDKNYSPLNTRNSINRVYELFSQEFNSKNRNINISNDEIIEGENVIFHMTTTQKQDYYLKNNLFYNISSIDLGECEKILQKEYKINEPLIIIKTDIKRNDTVSTQVEYEVYNPYNLQKLNLSYCSNSKVNIYPPINLDKETYDLAKHLKEQGYDLFNSYDDFYNDICSSYNSYNDTDVILNDRRNDFYIPNITLCEENCQYEQFLIEPSKAKCSCNVKTEVKSETSKVKFYPNKIIENFYKIESYANIKVVICYKEVFNLNKLIKNYGSYFMIIIGVLFIISMSFLFVFIDNKIVKILKKLFLQYKHMIIQLNQIEKNNQSNNKPNQIENKPNIKLKEKARKGNKTAKKIKSNIKLKNKSNPIKKAKQEKKYSIKNKTKLSKRRASLNYCNSNNVSNSFRNLNQSVKMKQKKITKNIININGIFIFSNKNINSNYNSQSQINKEDKIDSNESKNENKFIDKIIYLIPMSKRYKYFGDEELNSLNYEYALQIDFRTFFQFYFCLLKETHLIIFTFFVRNDYNIFLLKLSLFIISFALFLFMNTLFFSDDSMHKIYEDEGKYDILYQIPQTLYSTIVSQIISSLLEILSLSNDEVIGLKEKVNKKEVKQELIKIRKSIKIKCVIFFVVGIILLFGFWYYISAFCVVYYNTQIPLIKDNFISFFTSMTYPFLLNLLPGFFRIISLRFKIKFLFIISKILTKIIGIL